MSALSDGTQAPGPAIEPAPPVESSLLTRLTAIVEKLAPVGQSCEGEEARAILKDLQARHNSMLRRIAHFAAGEAISLEIAEKVESERTALGQERKRLSRLNRRLARATASCAEQLADASITNGDLSAVNERLALVNARGSELLAQVEERNEQIERLNGALASSNVYAAELVVELERQIAEREQAEHHLRELQGILPICMYCHMIRDDKQLWKRLETYFEEHSDVLFSHGLCPGCLEEHYPEDPA